MIPVKSGDRRCHRSPVDRYVNLEQWDLWSKGSGTRRCLSAGTLVRELALKVHEPFQHAAATRRGRWVGNGRENGRGSEFSGCGNAIVSSQHELPSPSDPPPPRGALVVVAAGEEDAAGGHLVEGAPHGPHVDPEVRLRGPQDDLRRPVVPGASLPGCIAGAHAHPPCALTWSPGSAAVVPGPKGGSRVLRPMGRQGLLAHRGGGRAYRRNHNHWIGSFSTPLPALATHPKPKHEGVLGGGFHTSSAWGARG